MRMRSTVMAVLVAAGLSVTMTGAAAAGEPGEDRDVVIVTCENGEPVERVLTDEERERLRALPAPPEREEVHRAERGEHVERAAPVPPEGRVTRVAPAERGKRLSPAEACAVRAEPRE